MRRLHAAHFHHLRHLGKWESSRSQSVWIGGIHTSTSDNLVSSYLHAQPFLNLVNRHITEVGCHVYTPRLTYTRWGIYDDNGYKYPGKLVADFGETYGSQGDHWLTGLDVWLRGNKIYWAAMNTGGSEVSCFTHCYTMYQMLESHFNIQGGCLRVAYAYGVHPNPFPAGAEPWHNIVAMLMR